MVTVGGGTVEARSMDAPSVGFQACGDLGLQVYQGQDQTIPRWSDGPTVVEREILDGATSEPGRALEYARFWPVPQVINPFSCGIYVFYSIALQHLDKLWPCVFSLALWGCNYWTFWTFTNLFIFVVLVAVYAHIFIYVERKVAWMSKNISFHPHYKEMMINLMKMVIVILTTA
uniref:Uncharacterized protein n=1 Tax=Sphaerodactylus townsendi TaxID=933632 RepID=A0ACB8E6J7_9SAUR